MELVKILPQVSRGPMDNLRETIHEHNVRSKQDYNIRIAVQKVFNLQKHQPHA